jgi:hypothetical protein
MPLAKSTRSAADRSADELVFVGRAAPVEWSAEPAPDESATDDVDDYRNCPAYVAVTSTDAVESRPSVHEQVAQVVTLVYVFATIILLVGLAIGYAAR